jgi:hypothetical protein
MNRPWWDVNPYLGSTNPFPAPYPPPKNIGFPLPDLAASYDTSALEIAFGNLDMLLTP